MSSMRKSIKRASRCRMARICRAPSDGLAAGGAAGVGLGAARRESDKAEAMSSGRFPLNRMAKKLRNASIRRFNTFSSISEYLVRGVLGDPGGNAHWYDDAWATI